ncbi:hypothetical protein AXF42_Ash008743 [Apostasia shenzhenica]|uniref:Uncharacterized protein n=1 Tax=Apostasia shenzhenica TaxID=1088818 RepID=A0A2I0B286_9ASPA|nr:hypothetical protein AXF42_Ash008743 [Apostasia shenzhenica]
MELTAISEISAELTEISAILKLVCFLFLQKYWCPPLTLSRRKTALYYDYVTWQCPNPTFLPGRERRERERGERANK